MTLKPLLSLETRAWNRLWEQRIHELEKSREKTGRNGLRENETSSLERYGQLRATPAGCGDDTDGLRAGRI